MPACAVGGEQDCNTVRLNLSGEFGDREGEPFSLGDRCGQRGHRANIPSMKARVVGWQLRT
jgi:hypothetical protein